MAKISTYAFPSSPKSSDYVIGTDTSDSLNTKNFLISDIIGLAGSTYVPYTGATGNVDLGANNLTATRLIATSQVGLSTGAVIYTSGSAGTAGQVLISQGPTTSPQWTNIATAVDGNLYKGSFYDILTQTTTANTATPMLLRNTDSTCTLGFSIVANSKITAANTAVYNVAFSSQLYRTSGGTAETLDIWLRKNGTDIPSTNTRIDVANNSVRMVAAWNFFVQMNAGDYVEIMWAVTATTIELLAEAASGVHPETPSIIVTVNQV